MIITAGSAYLDIDAYACSAAMQELIELMGGKAVAYSQAVSNYSICRSLVEEGQVTDILPEDFRGEDARYIIVDVSDPNFIGNAVPLDKVDAVYDHHVGYEDYWQQRIGDRACIEFIGAAATLIYREWKKHGLQDRMKPSTAKLLVAAILDNTLNLTSQNTTAEDREAFEALCALAGIGKEWCAAYFMEVQESVEADLKNALFGDIKNMHDTSVLPRKVAQLCVWDAESMLKRLDQIKQWFEGCEGGWMINLIDLKRRCSFFVCEDEMHQRQIEKVFEVKFDGSVARTPVSYLRKEIIKKAYFN